MAVAREHSAVHDALVERMTSALKPVRRLWPVRVRLLLWLAIEIAVLLYFLLMTGERSDPPTRLGSFQYLAELGASGLAAILAAMFALRAAIPGRAPSRPALFVVVALAVLGAAPLFGEPLGADVTLAVFAHTGVGCLTATLALAAIPWAVLLWLIGRGAPLEAGLAGGLAGAAAMLFSFAIMRVHCPLDERLHLLVFHLLPALLGIAASILVGVLLFRGRLRTVR